MILYINTILDLLDIYNASAGEEFKQLDIYDILDDIDDLENDDDIQKAISDLEKRLLL